MNIFAIIVTYNAMRRKWIDKCLHSLRESTLPCTPIVIDNGSTDGTREHVPANYPEAIWMPQQENLGFGQANNIGIRYALKQHADYALLLNQDATLAPDALERMVSASLSDTLVSPLQLNGDGSKLDIVFKMRLLLADNGLIDQALAGKELQSLYIGGEYSAACWLIPQKIMKEVGGFNPIFFHYGEDHNYINRVNYHGFKMALVPQAFMYHDRNIHGDQKTFNKNAMRRDMLIAICNINSSVLKAMGKWALLLFRAYAYELPKRNYIPGTFTIHLCWFAIHTANIIKSRRTDKIKQTNWL